MGEDKAASVVILAGGQGRRLGRDKSSLMLNGLTLLQHVVRRVQPLTDDLIVVLRRDQDLPGGGPWRVLRDSETNVGVIAGIAAGLAGARHDLVWVVGCDMPFASAELLQHEQRELGSRHDAVVPRLPVGLEPLHALYRNRCLDALQQAMASNKKSISQVLRTLCVHYLDWGDLLAFGAPERTFLNVNTPADLVRAESLMPEANGELACALSAGSTGSGARPRRSPPTGIRPGPPPDDGPRAG